jgi:predicted AAA+ superfamily ATPase
LRDSGILHALLNLPDSRTLQSHPRLGASWEGFAIEQILRILKPPQAFFWATHSGAAVDLFVIFHGRRYGIECKFSESPKITKSMNQAIESLNLDHLWIFHPGEHSYPLSEQVSVWPMKSIAILPKQLR